MSTTAAAVFDSMATLIEALAVTKATAGDGFLRFDGHPDPEQMPDRTFQIRLDRGPGDDEVFIRSNRRVMEGTVVVAYAYAPEVIDRIARDNVLLSGLLDGLVQSIADVQQVEKLDLPNVDYFANVVQVEHEFRLAYLDEDC